MESFHRLDSAEDSWYEPSGVFLKAFLLKSGNVCFSENTIVITKGTMALLTRIPVTISLAYEWID
jgi:hypothetical protein